MPGHECPGCRIPGAAEQQLIPGPGRRRDTTKQRTSSSSGSTTANIILTHVSCALTPSEGRPVQAVLMTHSVAFGDAENLVELSVRTDRLHQKS